MRRFFYSCSAAKEIRNADAVAPTEMLQRLILARINPPQYATKAGFTYDLKCVAADGELSAIPARDLRREATLELVSSRTLLDSTQSSAFLDSLSESSR
jgi:hypothetical protein